MNGKYFCPVCGWSELTEPPYDKNGGASYEGCPACHFETGYHDDPLACGGENLNLTREEMTSVFRNKWISEGMPWRAVSVTYHPEPLDWDPKKQLKNIGIEVE
ncbi:MAG: hypothetical protein WC730_02980 [Patescibacteria group bacterium]|jgi:hypothetical protein